MGRTTKDTGNLLRKVRMALSSRYFMYFVLGLVALQGLWYIASVRPNYFDEFRHVSVIRIYSQQIGPFISSQSEAWDSVGDVTRDPSYFYYFLMGYVLRVANIFTSNEVAQLIVMRIVNLAFFVAGVYVFWKLLVRVGGSIFVANITLLLFALIPIIAPLPGVVSYDNLVFLLSALLMLYAVRLVDSRKPKGTDLVRLMSVALLGSVVKFTFIALVAPVVCYVIYSLFIRRKIKPSHLAKDIERLGKVCMIALAALLVVSIGLFAERPVKNILTYRRVQPDCQQVLTKQRCLNNYTAKRNLEALATRPANFQPMTPYNFALAGWVPQMIRSQAIIEHSIRPYPLLIFMYSGFALGGVALILIQFKELMRKQNHRLLFAAMMGYSLILMAYNYVEYTKYGSLLAISGRYLMPVVPIFFYFLALSIRALFGKYSKTLIVLSVFVVLMSLTQGGGVATANLTIDRNLFWQVRPILDFNEKLTDLFSLLIIGNSR